MSISINRLYIIIQAINMKTFVFLAIFVAVALSCVQRKDAVSRGMEWVNAKVPYDANKYRDGYVQGCMGIVGYAWLFPKPGVYSGDLASTVCKRINKGQLEMADIMVNPGAHQLLFHSWANSDKSSYVAIELSGSRGCNKYTIPWPYWSGYNPQKYFPCKVIKACVTEEEDIVEQNLQKEQIE